VALSHRMLAAVLRLVVHGLFRGFKFYTDEKRLD
jgi:hypothetical protein